MDKQSPSAALILGLCIGIGLALAGWFVGDALYQARAAERLVTVKGLAERQVKADLAIWPINFLRTGNDLNQLQSRLDADRNKSKTFF